METASPLPAGGAKADRDKTGRNIWCPEYDGCLSNAARHDIPLECGECPMSETKIPVFVLTLSEIQGCKALMDAIFRPRREY